MKTQFDVETGLVLSTITDRVRARLVDEAIAAIRPEIVARVEALVREMRPQLEAYRDAVHTKVVLNFVVQEPRA